VIAVNGGDKLNNKLNEIQYSHTCKLCGEEIIWSVIEHLLAKHPDLPETQEIGELIKELWDKFVESE